MNISHISVFSRACALCGETTQNSRGLCDACLSELPVMKSLQYCERCAMPLTGNGVSQARLCGRCQLVPPAWHRCISCFEYADPVAWMIQAMKFNNELYYAALLGGLMAHTVAGRLLELPDIIMPVPLHRKRLGERGYNQALELARPVSRLLGIPVDSASCVRTRQGEAQSSLHADDREENIKGAFEVRRHVAAAHVAVVDDVMTTGSTVEALSLALTGAGVEKIQVWVCARA